MCQQNTPFSSRNQKKKKINKKFASKYVFCNSLPGPQQNIFESKQIIHYIKKNPPDILNNNFIIRCLCTIYIPTKKKNYEKRK